MGVKMNVTFGVAGNGVKLRQGGVRTLIATSEVTGLEMNLLQFTSLVGCPKTVYVAHIHVSLAFVYGIFV